MKVSFEMKICTLLLTGIATIGIQSAQAGAAEDNAAAEVEVLAIADQALDLISAEDMPGLMNLFLEQSMSYSSRLSDGSYNVRARSHAESLEQGFTVELVERGFDPTVLVSGPVAMIWYPYDIYVNGEWSHCGVDIFNFVRTDEGWKINSMTWSAEQPPACEPHPDGPPA